MKRILILLIISSSLLGILDAGYITWEKIQGTFPVCHPTFKCTEVLSSQWASVGFVPLSVLGLFFYGIFFGLAVYLYLGGESLKLGRWQMPLHQFLFKWSIVGGLFSIYLLTVMGVILQAWCLYCLLSAINCFVLLALATTSYRLNHKGDSL